MSQPFTCGHPLASHQPKDRVAECQHQQLAVWQFVERRDLLVAFDDHDRLRARVAAVERPDLAGTVVSENVAAGELPERRAPIHLTPGDGAPAPVVVAAASTIAEGEVEMAIWPEEDASSVVIGGEILYLQDAGLVGGVDDAARHLKA